MGETSYVAATMESVETVQQILDTWLGAERLFGLILSLILSW